MDVKTVGLNIRTFREKKNMSQSILGKLIGKGESTIGNYENGKIDIPCSSLLKIAEILELAPEEFFGVNHDDFHPLAELRIYALDDRQTVSGILIKNGYTVRQIKVPRVKGKSNYLCLQVKMEKNSMESQ